MPDFAPASAEIALLVLACTVLVVDVLLPPEKREWTYWLSQISLVVTGYYLIEAYATPGITFSGSFKLDTLAMVLKLTVLAMAFFVFAYSRKYLVDRNLAKGEYYLLGLFAVLGMLILVSAASLLTIYLGLELLSLSLYAMVALQRDSSVASEAAMKYFVLGALASGMLLYGMSMLFGATGTLNIDGIAEVIKSVKSTDKVLILGTVFVVVGIAFKLGAVPFHMWIPDVYQGAPSSVTLFIATAPKLAGFAMLIRLLAEGLGGVHQHWQDMLIIMAVLSMAIGNVVAIAQTNIKRMLAYSTIAHVGFLFLGVIPGTAESYAAALFYSIVYAVMALGAFGLVVILSRKGVEAEEIESFAGLNARHPLYAFMTLVIMLSMAGVPPFLGFWAKWNVLREVVADGMVWLAIVAVVFSIIGLFYYLRVARMVYFEPATDEAAIEDSRGVRVLMGLNGLFIIGLGVVPSGLLVICRQAFAS
ncbi:MAG: NADH-quinone oxidoreductase subunit NuoN [Gammaproteobacteria bacterium]|nr:NADH-quinone oxidoreductase subunit NuoN [Gammaproteobacteria bacterium]